MLRRSAGLAFVLVLVVVSAGIPVPPRDQPVLIQEATVTVYGRPGSFGALDSTAPSGQDLAKAGLPGWAFPPGRHPHRIVKVGNTLLMAARDLAAPGYPSAGDLFAATFDLGTKKFRVIRIPTTTGKMSVWRDDHAIAPSISDLLPLADDAVLFTAWPTQLHQNLGRDGSWPVLGLLTKVDGVWKVGPTWTGGSLHTAGWAKACPAKTQPPESDCGGLGRMAKLKSGDIVVAQRTGLLLITVDKKGLVVLKGQYEFPEGAGTLREVTAHPVEDRFVAGLEIFNGLPQIQEFKVDQGSIVPVSGRLRPPDDQAGFGAAAYDSRGNLWASRTDITGSGPLAIFTRPRCAPAALPVPCQPDFDVLQPAHFAAADGLMFDPATNTMVYLAQNGVMLAIRFDGKTFSIGNPVDLGSRLLQGGAGDSEVVHRLGVIDEGRIWLPGLQQKVGAVAAPYDHWLYSVSMSDLFAPAPHTLPSTPGRSLTLQAERTIDNGTFLERARSGTIQVLSNVVYTYCADFPPGASCANDRVAGNGFILADHSGLGVRRGGIRYQIKVLESGTYQLSVHASTFPVVKKSVVEVTVAGQVVYMPVSPGYAWRHTHAATVLTLPAGVHTVTVGFRPGEYGWFLNSMTFERI